MYVEAICPLCFTSHILTADMRGERYRCEGCEEVFIVNEKAKVTPRRPNRPRVIKGEKAKGEKAIDVLPIVTDEGPPRKKKKANRERPRQRPQRQVKGRIGLVMALASGGLLVIGLAALGIWWGFWGRDKGTTVAAVDTTKPDHEKPPNKENPKNDDKNGKTKGDTKLVPVKGPEEVRWKVRVDAPAKPIKLPVDFKRDIAGGSADMDIIIPSAAGSPFVAVGDGDDCQVWDLQRNAPAGKLSGQRFSNGPPLLSPDGAHLALVPFGQKDIVKVTELSSGKSMKIDMEFRADFVDFAGPGRIMAVARQGAGLRVRVWDVATGKREGDFDGPALGEETSLRPDMLAISPGGAYLAVATPDELWVWDLKSGTAVGRRDLAWNAGNFLFPCSGLSFSPDGRELAGLFQVKKQSLLVWWDVASGKKVDERTFEPAAVSAAAQTDYERHVLSWVGDNRGWLLYGQMFIDRTGDKPGGWPSSLLAPHPPYRWMIGPDHVATLPDGLGHSKMVTIRRFDPGK